MFGVRQLFNNIKRTSLNVNTNDQANHLKHCDQFIVLAHKFTRPSLSRLRRRYIGNTLSMLPNVSRPGTRTSPVVLPDPENVGIAVGIVLLSRIQAEIYSVSLRS